MTTLQQFLTNKYAPVAKETAIRQESGLNQKHVGEPDLEKFDAYILRRINSRADRITGILSNDAGESYVWPFTDQQLVFAYPNQDQAQRENTLRLQMSQAAEAVIAGVMGDAFGRAAPRDDIYRESRDYWTGDPNDPTDWGEYGRILRELRAQVKGAVQPGEINPVNTARLVIVSLRADGDEKRSQYCAPRHEY